MSRLSATFSAEVDVEEHNDLEGEPDPFELLSAIGSDRSDRDRFDTDSAADSGAESMYSALLPSLSIISARRVH